MALEGSLKDFGLADIFQLIHIQKKTGVLTLKNRTAQTRVLFENGQVILADKPGGDGLDLVGDVLAKAGRISKEQLTTAAQSQKQTQEKIGIILINMGAVNKEELIKAGALSVKETVFSLFKWKEGQYSFEPGSITYEKEYWSPINTEFILMEGVRRVDEWPFIEKRIPSIEMVFQKNQENLSKIKEVSDDDESMDDMFGEAKPQQDEIRLTKGEMNILNFVDGTRTVRMIIEMAHQGEFETCKALSNLLQADLIQPTAGSQGRVVVSGAAKPLGTGTPTVTLRNGFSLLVLGGVIVAGYFAAQGVLQWRGFNPNPLSFYPEARQQLNNDQIRRAYWVYYFSRFKRPESIQTLLSEGFLAQESVSGTDGGIVFEVEGGEEPAISDPGSASAD